MEVAGVEPDGESASCPVSICDSVVLSEALTEILTEISGKRGQKQANSGKISPPKNEERICLNPAYLKGFIK